jgi:hypothetical protein
MKSKYTRRGREEEMKEIGASSEDRVRGTSIHTRQMELETEMEKQVIMIQ